MDQCHFDSIPPKILEEIEAISNPLDGLVATMKSINAIFLSGMDHENVNVVISGEWRRLFDRKLASVDAETLAASFQTDSFNDHHHDNYGVSLSLNDVWLRRRFYADGKIEWCLKFDIVRFGDEVLFKEMTNPVDIVSQLQIPHSGTLTRAAASQMLAMTYVFPISKTGIVRLQHPHAPNVCFEVVNLRKNAFYSLLRFNLPLNGPPSADRLHTTHSKVVGKLFASMELSNRRHFNRLFPNAIPAVITSECAHTYFSSKFIPAKTITMAEIHAIMDETSEKDEDCDDE